MAISFSYPSPAVVERIMPDLLKKSRENRLGLKLFPPTAKSTFHVRWVQKDAAYGLMQMRGLDGQPPRVQRVGENAFVYEPGVYGEHVVISEREILTRASSTYFDRPIPIDDLVKEADDLLIARQDDRMEYNVWTLLTTGTLTIPLAGPAGGPAYTDSYTFQTFTSTIPWATFATSTPIQDFQTVQQKGLGHGGDFGAGGNAYCNQYTANLLLNNSNSADFGGRRAQVGSTLNNLGQFNNYLQSQNLPPITVYDDGFLPYAVSGTVSNPATQFQKFIPDHKIVVVARRPDNAPVGEMQQTIQAMMPGGGLAAGEYRYVKDYASGINAPIETPPKIEVHRGYNGGPAVLYPNSIVIMTV